MAGNKGRGDRGVGEYLCSQTGAPQLTSIKGAFPSDPSEYEYPTPRQTKGIIKVVSNQDRKFEVHISGGEIVGLSEGLKTSRPAKLPHPPSTSASEHVIGYDAVLETLRERVATDVPDAAIVGTINTEITQTIDYEILPSTRPAHHQPRRALDSATNPLTTPRSLDLLGQMRYCYRLLELYQEQGSGGLVEKILIDEVSIVRLCNDIEPGTSAGIDRVDFAKLDETLCKIFGVFGDQRLIVQFLLREGCVDERTAALLLKDDVTEGPLLQPGLYLVTKMSKSTTYVNGGFVFFWPEKTTFDKDAMSNVSRNKINFLRYLTQLTDQVVVLANKDQLGVIGQTETAPVPGDSDDEDDNMRFHDYQVSKADDQGEGLRLLTAQKKIGLLVAKFQPASTVLSGPIKEYYNRLSGRQLMQANTHTVTFAPEFGAKAIRLLLQEEFLDFTSQASILWEELEKQRVAQHDGDLLESIAKARRAIEVSEGTVEAFVGKRAVQALKDRFKNVNLHNLSASEDSLELDALQRSNGPLLKDVSYYLETSKRFWNTIQSAINDPNYKKAKQLFLIATHSFRSADSDSQKHGQRALMELQRILAGTEHESAVSSSKAKSWWTGPLHWLKASDPQKLAADSKDDATFLLRLDEIATEIPDLATPASQLASLAGQWIKSTFEEAVSIGKDFVQQERLDAAEKHCRELRETSLASAEAHDARDFVYWLNDEFSKRPRELNNSDEVYIKDITQDGRSCQISMEKTQLSNACVRYEMIPLDVNESDTQRVVDDDGHVPTLCIRPGVKKVFELPVDCCIRSIHYLNDRQTQFVVLLDNQLNSSLEVYITRLDSPAKTFYYSQIGKDCLVTVDVMGRRFAIISSTCAMIYVYQLDDHQGCVLHTEADLSGWYPSPCEFVGATLLPWADEMVLVERSGKARIYSLVIQQCRPTSTVLEALPEGSLLATPEGYCFLYRSKVRDDHQTLLGYHTSFGTESSQIDLDLQQVDDFCFLTIHSTDHVYLVHMSAENAGITIQRLVVANSAASSQLHATAGPRLANEKKRSHHDDPLLGSFYDLWDRYPVVAAIERDNLSSRREARSVTLVGEEHLGDISATFNALWKRMIASFKLDTCKPTRNVLENIVTRTGTLQSFHLVQTISEFKFGEWLVEMFCLIPLHLAVAKDNKFIPYRNGRDDVEWEKRLLGQNVATIASTITLGWYEAILSGYLVNRVSFWTAPRLSTLKIALQPVRVISSLGSQSVGKSYTLNHMASSSFAGAAGRTTEGVWLAVTPTKECIYVLLDFEGVNSPERSAQEDSLLILLNSALSNMVLFRNNLDVGRDFRRLFAPFQSSANVFDSKDNPQLFNGRLVMLIRDVMDSAADEAVIEFRLKFDAIVNEEGDNNFITNLYRNQLAIIAWPVIKDTQFYTKFNQLNKELSKQKITYKSAGEFTQILKLVEAKLMTSDWSSLDSTLVTLRTTRLRELLLTALSTGRSELGEPLTNLDTFENVILPTFHWMDGTQYAKDISPGSLSITYHNELLPQYRQLQYRPRPASDREWRGAFAATLREGLEHRFDLVEKWLKANTKRFPDHDVNVRSLFGELSRFFHVYQVYPDLQTTVLRGNHPCRSGSTLWSSSPQLTRQPSHLRDPMSIVRVSLHSPARYAFYKVALLLTDPPLTGHREREHETRHGNMTKSQWTMSDSMAVNIGGHKFGSGDDGAPMLCNIVCSARHPRHTHVAFCQTPDSEQKCTGDELEHIAETMTPDPDRAKEWGSRQVANFDCSLSDPSQDPYSRSEQQAFKLCDFECPGEEHQRHLGDSSHCILPMLHVPASRNTSVTSGHISHDGHHYLCNDPLRDQQAYHVIFVLDRSTSMTSTDSRPVLGTPSYSAIARVADNRYGAVLSACFAFWSARQTLAQSAGFSARRDAYSVILFNKSPLVLFEADSTSSAAQLLTRCLRYRPDEGTNFDAALTCAKVVMQRNWSSERTPVVILLSDGECATTKEPIQNICRRAANLQKPLNFHAVSFGPDAQSDALRAMAQQARDIYRRAPKDTNVPAHVACTYSTALDTVALANTFLNIAGSLRRSRGSLMNI
ncbi:hypothetical protein P7C73_g826, partial [Tremellales sp. Uapishka_1]